MDISAYMEPTVWQALLDELGLSDVKLRDARYDAHNRMHEYGGFKL